MTATTNVRRSGAVVEIELHNPEQRNALTPGMIERISDTISESERDESARVVILRGSGGWFSSGYALDHSPSVVGGQSSYGADVAALGDQIERSRLVSIASIRGFAVGAGLDVACACDFRFAERTAFFALPAVKLGIVYPWRGMRRVRRAVGPAVARRIFLAAERISIDEALSCGLVARVFENELELSTGTWSFANELAERSGAALSGMKRTFRELAIQEDLPPEVTAELEAMTRATMDSADELRAASEKAAAKRPAGARSAG